MNILRQLWQDMSRILRDMSTTQRVAVTFLILTVGIWLSIAVWLGSTPSESGQRPLPILVEPGSSNDMLNLLKSKGIRSGDYDMESRRIVVNADEEKPAIIALAEENLLNNEHDFGFLKMLDGWAFSDPTKKSDEAMRIARANEVAKLIEMLDPVKSAKVIYSDDARNSLFGASHKKTASVQVTTKIGKQLNDQTADTIISLVAAAKAGLNPLDVVVTDQNGTKFSSSNNNVMSHMARQKSEYESAEDEKLRRKLENLMRKYIANIHEGGDVDAYVKHDINFDYVEQMEKMVLPGEVATQQSEKYTATTQDRPGDPVGVNPNASRLANLVGHDWQRIHESKQSRTSSARTMQNSLRETMTKFAPHTKNLTIAAVINLPYRFKLDDEGKRIPLKDDDGEVILDPETRKPMYERESVPPLSNEDIAELKRQIAQAAGIGVDEIPDKIEVSQRPWRAPVTPPRGGDPFATLLVKMLSENMNAIFTFILFTLAVFFVYRYATRPIPTEIEEPLEEERLELAMTSEEEEDEVTDEEWEKLHNKVVAAVQEDPKSAAMLLKRWMQKE